MTWELEAWNGLRAADRTLHHALPTHQLCRTLAEPPRPPNEKRLHCIFRLVE